ncbi:hypothetical protein, partial [Thiolapillus sp.]|uniref:hypothetical protein n=1 Tax=Thiolapillus sp. TaxID=2017437 RepID=UPI003AF703A2
MSITVMEAMPEKTGEPKQGVVRGRGTEEDTLTEADIEHAVGIVAGTDNDRCQPWRAKRRLVVPSSREAALFSRRALRQRENKVGLRTRR